MLRIKDIFGACIVAVSALALSSCGKSGGGDEPVPPTPVDPVSRTVLVYMVAANSLGNAYVQYDGVLHGADTLDLQEMELAASKGALGSGRWLVFHSTYSDSKLLELTSSGFKTLKTYEQDYATSASRMKEVLDDVDALAPAYSHGIVLWSHANGWLEDGDAETSTSSAASQLGDVSLQSFGLHSGHKMNVTTLADVLYGRNLDYIYFDCCLMGSVEVAYQLRDCAKYIVASPSELPRDGMPYDQNVSCLIDGSRDALVDAAKNTFNLYDGKTDPEDRTATMSVIDTQYLPQLASATAEIYMLTDAVHPYAAASQRVTNYYGSSLSYQANYLDFGEYVNALIESVGLEHNYAFADAMSKVIVWSNATPYLWNKWPIYNASGLSTRVFNSEASITSNGYDRLDWTTDVVVKHFPALR